MRDGDERRAEIARATPGREGKRAGEGQPQRASPQLCFFVAGVLVSEMCSVRCGVAMCSHVDEKNGGTLQTPTLPEK